MDWQKKDHRAGERNCRSYSVTDNSIGPHEKNTQNQIRNTFHQSGYGQSAVLTHPKQHTSRSGLREHEGRRNQHDHEHWVTLHNVLLANPHFDDGFPQNDKQRANGKNDKRAEPIACDKDLPQAVNIPCGI